ncbi:MAG: hypothetical protein ACK41V_20120 [Acidovorax sp.]|uniref:hypothetical protein n=1 Tax=Acidovorax sp. TaxID=1872122 RepID=UPI00391CC10C
MNPFVGTWVGPDEYTSEVQYLVREAGEQLEVCAIDQSDGEVGDVSSVALAEGELAFVVLWRSTGRVASCRLKLLVEGEAELTFTFTDHVHLVKRGA